MPIPENILKVENLLNKFSKKNLALLVTSEKTLNNIIKFLETVFDESEQMVHEDSDIGFSTSNASTIKTNGSINIINIGVINTDLYSDRDIRFNKENAVLRGGKIEARGSIKAGEIGTETGKPPYLIAGDKIFVHYLRNARVQILSRTRNFFEQLKNVTIYYDEKSDELKTVHR
ncbi:hypothetical protein BKP35_06225 [Anaerobacillus arseniciselenatis]|uniref:Septum formation inhibitor MinC C-terminal domain-containing protein n=2 Tax=Anaerobacillus arseniciselenatis TaxID=85682 RepID=A0A1S2LR95_9BACI|nr:hypothetical protein BKP35_06225 [Anaerobacillus arseniciselenatis]